MTKIRTILSVIPVYMEGDINVNQNGNMPYRFVAVILILFALFLVNRFQGWQKPDQTIFKKNIPILNL